MKSFSPMTRFFSPFLMATVLAACAVPQDSQHKEHHPDTSSPPQTSGATSSGMANGQMSSMDMQAMCDMHRKMMGAKTPEERQAMMDDRMKTMSPEMMQRHMQMMEQQCK